MPLHSAQSEAPIQPAITSRPKGREARKARRRAKRDKILSKKDRKARQVMLDEVFYDVYPRLGRIYKVNFFRGIFFGLGTFIGGTIVVALVVALLSWLGNTFNISPFIEIVQVVEDTRSTK